MIDFAADPATADHCSLAEFELVEVESDAVVATGSEYVWVDLEGYQRRRSLGMVVARTVDSLDSPENSDQHRHRPIAVLVPSMTVDHAHRPVDTDSRYCFGMVGCKTWLDGQVICVQL